MNQAPQNMDHLNETMLYKCPGPHEFHGGRFDYVIVPEADIEEAKSQGWHLTTKEASAAHEAAITAPPPALPVPLAQLDTAPEPIDATTHLLATQANNEHLATSLEQANAGQVQVRELIDNAALEAPVTYDEMKTKATQLGLEYPGNISKAALLAMITAKLAEQV
jgi:hypothetical protein